jgi:hypothetical protein
MIIFTVSGRISHTVIHCRKTAEEAFKLEAEMIAAGFKNVRVSKRCF